MRHTFLTALPPTESWRKILVVLLDVEFNFVAAAKRLHISRTHLYTWLNRNPSFKTRLELEKRRYFGGA